jgi:competence protein ComEC
MSQELTQLFTRTGLRHVLAVSGSHVTLLAGTLLAPLLARARGGRSFVPAVLLAAAAAALAAMTGSQAPVRRAAIALAASAFAPRVAGVRRVDTLSLLALGLVLEATFDVRIVFSVSLLLSYVATASLLLGARCIAEAIVFPIPSRTLGPTTLGRATMTVTTRWTRFALAASIAAVTWTLPLIWITFGEWSPIGVLLTIVTTPLFAWELVVGWLVLLVPGSGLAALFDAPAHALVELLKASDACAGTPHVLPVRPAEFVLAAGALLVFATASRRAICGLSPRWIGAAACASWAALLAPWAARPRALVVDVLDVGHGTCVVARGPGGPAWIFDAGSRDRTRVGPGALGPLLADCEAGEVVVVLSHDDSDHAAGLEWLVERYPVRFWAGALPAPVGERLPHTAGRADSRGAGDELILERLGPERAVLSRGTTEEGNEGSRTLFLTWAGTAIALHGDALEAGLERQLRSHARNGPFQALLWPHHGDDTAWMARLIAEQPATEVWISGSGPARAEIELGRRGIPVRATARSGPLHFDFEPP